jgi:hypothetical protein
MDPVLVNTAPYPDHFPDFLKHNDPWQALLPAVAQRVIAVKTPAPAVVVPEKVLDTNNFYTLHNEDQPAPAPEFPPATLASISFEDRCKHLAARLASFKSPQPSQVPIPTQYALGAAVIVNSGSTSPVPSITHQPRLSPCDLKDNHKIFGGHPDNTIIVIDIPLEINIMTPPEINIIAPRCTRLATRLASFNYPPPYLGDSDNDHHFGPNTLLSPPANDNFAFTRFKPKSFTRFKPKSSINKLPSSAIPFKNIRTPVRPIVPDHPPDLISSSSDDATDHIRSVGIPARRRRRRRN